MSGPSTTENSSSSTPVWTAAPLISTDRDDSCTWYNGRECETPRSCEDCLNVAVSGDSCAIDAIGRCVSASTATAQDNFFPASGLSYCANNDATCITCWRYWTAEYTHDNVPSSSVCVGDGGCICLASCSMPSRRSLILRDDACSVFGGNSTRIIIVLVISACAVVLFLFTTLYVRQAVRQAIRIRRDEQQVRSQTQRRVAREPQLKLNLSGWTDMREKLIAGEKEQLEGGDEDDVVVKPKLTSTEAPSAVIEDDVDHRAPSSENTPPRRI